MSEKYVESFNIMGIPIHVRDKSLTAQVEAYRQSFDEASFLQKCKKFLFYGDSRTIGNHQAINDDHPYYWSLITSVTDRYAAEPRLRLRFASSGNCGPV